MEKAFNFTNRNGRQLIGVLHIPGSEARSTGIVFVHAGIQGRHGNSNQYVSYARKFCQMGFTCLRFDPSGLGDGEGMIDPMPMRDFYGSVATGRYVEDTLDAMREFKKHGIKRIVLFGLCGGAITSLLTSPFSEDISGLILLSCPVMLDSANVDWKLKIPGELAGRQLQSYLTKLFKPKYWLRVFTLKTDFRTIAAYIQAVVREKIIAKNKDNEKNKATSDPTAPTANNKFFEAYSAIKKRMGTLWIFGDNDGFWYDYKKEFLEKNYLGGNDRLTVIEGANHMFTVPEWQAQVLAASSGWLEERA